MREFIINENDGGQRLDKFISKLMPRLPKSMMYKGLRKNCVKLNGKHARDGAIFLEAGDEVALYFKDEFFESRPAFRYIERKPDIVYEDGDIMVVNKPVGLLSHADERGLSPVTLIGMIQSCLYERGEYDPEAENSFSPALSTRLDRNTSGLVIAAKNAVALREMNARIRGREVEKYYTAVVEGYPKVRGRLDGFIAREDKITRITNAPSDKRVSLSYRVLARLDGYSLVEILLETGRTHQIRAQFSDAGFPLAGDTKYGGHGGIFRQELCSTRLRFSFSGDGGRLAHLRGMEIKITPPFAEKFSGESVEWIHQ